MREVLVEEFSEMEHESFRVAVTSKIRLARVGYAHDGTCGALDMHGFDVCAAKKAINLGGGPCGAYIGNSGTAASCRSGGGSCGSGSYIIDGFLRSAGNGGG